MQYDFIKRFIVLTSIFLLSISYVSYAAPIVNYKLAYDGKIHNYSAEEVYIKLNGNDINVGDMPPIVLNDRTLVPARAVFEAMGAEVLWNEDSNEIFISKNNNIIIIKIGNKTGTKNGNEFIMDVPPMIINDRTMIPIRAISEALECNVEWDGKNRYVIINDGMNNENEPMIPNDADKDDIGISTSELNPNGTEVDINSITLPQQGSPESYIINSTGQILKYNSQLIDNNRLLVDIYSSNMMIQETEIKVNNSSNVDGIRVAQNQILPEKITRVVFDLKTSHKNYNISFNTNKTGIIVSFDKNDIISLNTNSSSILDTIVITGKYQPVGNISMLTNPDRIVIDFPNSNSNLPHELSSDNLKIVSSISTSQFDANTTRIVLNVPSGVDVNTSNEGNNFIINISKGTLQNISYDNNNRTIIMKKVSPISLNSIIHKDDYLNYKYIITLPGNYLDIYGYGSYNINNEYVDKFVVGSDSSGNTTITFEQKQITAYTILEDEFNYYIKIQNPKEKYDCVLLLDAGHGGIKPGTSGNGFIEKDLNLDVVLKLYKLFENDGKDDIKVYLIRDADTHVENTDRSKIANESADLFISIHMNSSSPNPVPNGTEVLYDVHSNEVEGKLTSKEFAQVMLDYVLKSLDTKNRGIKLRNDLIVLNSTKMPAILIEAVFLSNLGDAQKINDPVIQQKLAQAIYDATYYVKQNYKIR